MPVAVLLDENVEKDLGRKLVREGYDVQHVVDVPGLGPGATDADIRRHALEHDRIIVTYDDHFADPPSASDLAGVFYCPNQYLPTFDVFRIIESVISAYDTCEDLPPVVFLSSNWL